MIRILHLILGSIIVMLSACYPRDRVMELSSSSKEAQELFSQARQLFQEHKFERSQELLREAIRHDPDFAVAYAMLNDEANVGKAMDLIDNTSRGEELFIRYKWAAINLNIEEEISCLERMTALLPDDPWPHYYLGLTYHIHKQNLEMSASEFLKALELDPNHIISLNRLGYYYVRRKMFDLAEQTFKQYIAIAPHVANAYDSYAEFLITRQRYDESFVLLEKCMEVDPEWMVGYAKIGELYAFKGMHKKAIEYYNHSLELIEDLPTIRFVYNWKAASLYSLGEYNNVITLFDELGEIMHSGEMYIFELDRYEWPLHMSFFLGDFEQVLYFSHQYDNFVERNLSNFPEPNALRFTAKLRMALAHGLVGNRIESDRLLSLAGQMVFDLGLPALANKWYQTILGWLEIHRGNYEQAIVCFETDEFDLLLAKYWHGYAYQQAGYEETAQEIYSEIRPYYTYTFPYALCMGKLSGK